MATTHEQLEANSLGADNSLRRYLEDIRTIPMLTREEEVELARRARAGDDAARARIVRANLRFVVSFAKRYQHRGLPLVDLVAEGNLGLVRAVDRFDETLGYKFISYAVWWVRQAILQALSRQARPMRIPAGRTNRMLQLERLHDRLEQETSDSVAWDRVVDEVSPGVSADGVLSFQARVSSLDAHVGEDDVHLSEILFDERAASPAEELEMQDCREALQRAMEGLDQREQMIVKRFFGLDTEERRTLEEIGVEFRLTRERIRQIKDRALRKLRHASRNQTLRDYLAE